MSDIEVEVHLRGDIKVTRNTNEILKFKNHHNAEDRKYKKYHN
jgi:hypothetical protein